MGRADVYRTLPPGTRTTAVAQPFNQPVTRVRIPCATVTYHLCVLPEQTMTPPIIYLATVKAASRIYGLPSPRTARPRADDMGAATQGQERMSYLAL
eukprot:4225570-Prymnesium_polylepis.1